MATHYNAQMCRDENKYSIQFETRNFGLYRLVENVCRAAVDENTKTEKTESGSTKAAYMDFDHTIEMMCSPDYKERFKAEYYQLKIRQGKLIDMLVKYKANTLDFVPHCSYDLLYEQAQTMGKYLILLEARALIEGIKL